MYLVILVYLQRSQLTMAVSLDVLIRKSSSSLSPVLVSLLEFTEQVQELELRYLDESTSFASETESTLTNTIILITQELQKGTSLGTQLLHKALLRRGEIRLRKQAYQGACGKDCVIILILDDFTKVLNASFDVKCLKYRAECYVRLDRFEEAVTDLRTVLQRTGDSKVSERIMEVMKEWGGQSHRQSSTVLPSSNPKSKGLFGNIFGSFSPPPPEPIPPFRYDPGFGMLKTQYEDCCDKLGVRITDSLEAIKKRFHFLALQYHPDKNPSDEAQQQFVEIRKAYEYVINNYSSFVCKIV